MIGLWLILEIVNGCDQIDGVGDRVVCRSHLFLKNGGLRLALWAACRQVLETANTSRGHGVEAVFTTEKRKNGIC